MKNVMKKIVMMGMLSCMVSLNLYTKNSASHGNLMQEPLDSISDQPVNITVSNLPADTFIAAGTYYHKDGKTNYSQQGTGRNGSYTFHPNYYYAAAAKNRRSFMHEHKGTDFIGKTKWDVANNIIS